MDVKQPLKAFEQDGVEEVNLGQHVLAEFFECDPNILNSIERLLCRNASTCLTLTGYPVWLSFRKAIWQYTHGRSWDTLPLICSLAVTNAIRKFLMSF